jgi:hypothetical protein
MALETWYTVTFDDTHVYRDVRPPGGEAWKDSFKWEDVIRVCFQTDPFLMTDEIYIFVKGREESYLIPTEALGGSELWGEIIGRDLFDAKLGIKVATMGEEEMECWPKFTEEEIKKFSS